MASLQTLQKVALTETFEEERDMIGELIGVHFIMNDWIKSFSIFLFIGHRAGKRGISISHWFLDDAICSGFILKNGFL